jgi:hypothetical protein
MGISINIQRIRKARARAISHFSTVDLFTDHDEFHEGTIYLEGPGHYECATRITQLINEQIARRDAPPVRNDERAAALAADDAAYDEEDQQAEQQHIEEMNAEISEQDQAAIDRAKYDRDDDLPF